MHEAAYRTRSGHVVATRVSTFTARSFARLAVANTVVAVSFAMMLMMLAWPAGAAAQPNVDLGADYVNRANMLYRDVPSSRAGHNELLMGLMDLARPPAPADTPDKAALLTMELSSWPAVESWADRPGSRRALDALERFTGARQHEEVPVFAQPYGVEGVPRELIDAGLYTELGSPPLLASADHGYLERMGWLRSLVHVEATRLMGEGEADEALDLLISLLVFGRQMADRQFFAESVWGMETMVDAVRRARDVVYVDFHTTREVRIEAIEEMIGVLAPDAGVLALDRLRLPGANKVAARQLVAEMYEPGDGTDTGFGITVARLESSARPLRRFGAVGSAQDLADDQLEWEGIVSEIDAVFGDWEKRWTLGAFDPLLKQPSAYASFDRGPRQAVFLAAGSRLRGRVVSGDDLFELRRVFEAARVGTRMSLAVVGRTRVVGQHPPTLRFVRPAFVDRLDSDPYNENRERGAQPEPMYFAPVDGDPIAARPERMRVRARGESFTWSVLDSHFILYSVGNDGDDDLADDVGESPADGGDDVLFWPPAISLLRSHLEASGSLR